MRLLVGAVSKTRERTRSPAQERMHFPPLKRADAPVTFQNQRHDSASLVENDYGTCLGCKMPACRVFQENLTPMSANRALCHNNQEILSVGLTISFVINVESLYK